MLLLLSVLNAPRKLWGHNLEEGQNPGQRRRITSAAVLLMLAAALALTLVGDAGKIQAQSQTGRTLISNVEQPSIASNNVELGTANDLAQAFTTGDSISGYTLTSVELRLQTASGTTPPTVTLHTGFPDSTGTKVADFTGPSALMANTTQNYTYTPLRAASPGRGTL